MLQKLFRKKVLRGYKFSTNYNYFDKMEKVHDLQNDQFLFKVDQLGGQYIDEPIKITMQSQQSLEDFQIQLREKFPELISSNKLTFQSIDKKQLSKTITMEDIMNENFYVVMNDKTELFHVQNRLESIHTCNKNEQLQKLFKNVNLPYLDQEIILQYLERLEHINETSQSSVLSGSNNSLVDKEQLIQNMIEALPNIKNIKTRFDFQLITEYLQTKETIDSMKNDYDYLTQQAHKKAKQKMGLGLLGVVAQFQLVGYGIYVSHSWDIMEPIVYFTNFAVAIALSFQFFRNHEDFSNSSLFEFIKKQDLKKMQSKYQFDIQKYEEMLNHKNNLENKIKANILQNL